MWPKTCLRRSCMKQHAHSFIKPLVFVQIALSSKTLSPKPTVPVQPNILPKARSPKAEPEAFQIELLTLRGCLEGPMKALLRGSIRVLGLGSGFGV